MTLEGVDDVERSDSLTLGVLGVGDGVSDDVLEAGVRGVVCVRSSGQGMIREWVVEGRFGVG